MPETKETTRSITFRTTAGGFGDILDTEDSQEGNRRYCDRACTATLSFYSVYNP
jgi:hypothetical protein